MAKYVDVINIMNLLVKNKNGLTTTEIATEISKANGDNLAKATDKERKNFIRKIQRTLQSMVDDGTLPIECNRNGNTNAYKIEDSLNPYTYISHNNGLKESLLLHLAKQRLEHLLPKNILGETSALLELVDRTLNEAKDENKDKQWPKKIGFSTTTQPLIPPKIDDGVFDTVTDALYNNCKLHITYKKYNDEIEADISPLGIVQHGQRVLLVYRAAGTTVEKNIGIHRIIRAEKGASFSFGFDRFDLQKYIAESRHNEGTGNKVKISFIAREKGIAYYLEASELSYDHDKTDQKVEPLKDGTYRITATVYESKMLKRWLDGFGEAISDLKIERVPESK